MDSPEDNKPTQTIIAKEGSTVKNVIQAIIHLPGWAWIVGVVIISVALLLVSAVFNVEPLQALLPTPTAFAAATEGQSLIIVADFEDRSGGKYDGIDPAQYVYEQLLAQVQKDNLDIRVERLRQVVDDNSAKPTGETYNATLVIWGWYDILTITPRMERIKTLGGYTSDQEGLRFSLADPTKVEFSVVTDLPSQTGFLVMFTLGSDKYSNKDFDAALKYFNNAILSATTEKIISTNPKGAYIYRAMVYLNKNDCQRTILDTSKYIELTKDTSNPMYNFGHYLRGLCYYETYEYDKALLDFNKVLNNNPTDDLMAETFLARGTINDMQGLHESAIADFTKAIDLNPTKADYYHNRGFVYDAKGDYDRAIADYNKAIELNPKDPYYYNNRAIAYRTKGDYDRAIADYNKAIELDPTDADYYNHRGNAYGDKGDYDRAIADYSKAIELSPKDADYYRNRGSTYDDKSDYHSAIADYTKAIALTPDAADVYSARCFIHINYKYYDLALADCNDAIEIDPLFVPAYINRGLAYYRKHYYDRAISDWTKAIELGSEDDAIAYHNRGLALAKKGDYDHAITDYTKVIELDPEYIFAYYNRGIAYSTLGRTNEAIKDFEKVLEISTDPELRQQAEEEIKKLKGQ